jgi:hypothetical protein
MATLEDYNRVAPTVQSIGNFTKAQIETNLAKVPALPVPAPEPTITKAKIVAVFNDLFNGKTPQQAIEQANGIANIAKTHDLTVHQLKTIVDELVAMYSVYKGTTNPL